MKYPHANAVLEPVQSFLVGPRTLYLYLHTGRTPGCAYSLYYEGEFNPVQHAMSEREVYAVLSDELRKAHSQVKKT